MARSSDRSLVTATCAGAIPHSHGTPTAEVLLYDGSAGIEVGPSGASTERRLVELTELLIREVHQAPDRTLPWIMVLRGFECMGLSDDAVRTILDAARLRGVVLDDDGNMRAGHEHPGARMTARTSGT